MQFLGTKQVPEMPLTGNLNSLSSIAGVCATAHGSLQAVDAR